MEELLSLKWNNHRSTFLHILTILRNKELYTDVTLACDGRFYSVHKLVLSTCSDYFSAIFDRTTCKNPIIVLKDIKCEDLEALLDYMYLGEVNVRQADLASLIKAAECLRVKGLAVPDDEPPKKGSHSDSSVRRPDGVNSPPAKRKRRNEEQDGRDDVRPKSTPSHSRLSPPPNSESGRSSPHLSDGNPNSLSHISEDGQQIKVEKDDEGSIIEENYNMSNDAFKEEPNTDPGGDLSNDLPEFLQQASGSSYSHSYPGPSYQPDLQNWQGDQVLGGNFSGMGFGPTQSQDTSQNTSTSGRSPCSSGSFSSAFSSILAASLQQAPSSVSSSRRPPSISESNLSKSSSCRFCDKIFWTSWEMRRHLRVHEDIRPFLCSYCSHRSNFKHNLKSHIQLVHKGLPFSFTYDDTPSK